MLTAAAHFRDQKTLSAVDMVRWPRVCLHGFEGLKREEAHQVIARYAFIPILHSLLMASDRKHDHSFVSAGLSPALWPIQEVEHHVQLSAEAPLSPPQESTLLVMEFSVFFLAPYSSRLASHGEQQGLLLRIPLLVTWKRP